MQEEALHLTELTKYCKLTDAICGFYTEAAAVCLENVGHQSIGVGLVVEGEYSGEIKIKWKKIDLEAKASWGNLEEAVEYAAYAIAIMTIFVFTEYQIVRQSIKGTGFDYWIGKKDNPLNNECGIVEVSGILRGTKSRINERIKIKSKQIRKVPDQSSLAFIVVSEMSKPIAKIISL